MRAWVKILMCVAMVAPATLARADKSTDTAETAAGKRTPPVADATEERKFIVKAASGGMAEVKLGQLALEKGSSPTVKQFAQKMIDDHSKANRELEAIAAKKSVPMPTDVDSQHKATYEKLAKLSGPEFDKAYMEAMVKDHDEDVNDFKKATKTASDPEVKAWAQKTLDVIEQHDKIAHQDKDALKK